MKKSRSRSLALEKIALTRCPHCNGNGSLRPMFYEIECDGCNGLGRVKKDTGEALSPEEVITQQRIRMKEQRALISQLRREMADIQSESAGRGYGPAGARHHGD